MSENRLRVITTLIGGFSGIVLGAFFSGTFLFPPPRAAVSVQSVYNCPAWVSVTRSNATPRWTLTDCVWQDVDTSGGNHNLYFSIVNQFGAPATAYAHQAWPDGDVSQLTLGGQTNYGIYGGSFDPNRGQVGAYCGYVESRAASDVVCGIGLPLNRHVNYVLSFQQVTGAAQPTPTAITPVVNQNPNHYVTEMELPELVKQIVRDQWSKP